MNRRLRTSLILLAPIAFGSATVQADCLGDLNGDGMVDGNDLGLMLGVWNSSDPTGDLDDDGLVTGADFGLLIAGWGPCPCDGSTSLDPLHDDDTPAADQPPRNGLCHDACVAFRYPRSSGYLDNRHPRSIIAVNCRAKEKRGDQSDQYFHAELASMVTRMDGEMSWVPGISPNLSRKMAPAETPCQCLRRAAASSGTW